jgi:Prp8 binding protein
VASRRIVRPAWSPRGRYVACGAGDRSMVVWEARTETILYRLPGHRGSVGEVAWHPNVGEPIVASASADKTVYIGELLQIAE